MGLSRWQQIERLQRSVPSAASRSADNNIFDVGLRLSNGTVLTLRIELGPDFPQTPPVLRITDPGVTHEWLDFSGRVAGLSMLYHWNARDSDLGQVVQFALTQFCIKPPHVSTSTAASAAPRSSVSPQPPPLSNSSSPSTAQMESVQIPSDFAELDELTPAQLEELMTSEQAFATFFENLAVVSNLSTLKQSIQSENAAKALKNVSKSQQLDDAQRRLQALEEELDRERTKYSTMLQQEEASRVNPKFFADELEHLARQSDDLSEQFIHEEDLAEDLEASMARYRAMRVQYHSRKAKAELCRNQFT